MNTDLLGVRALNRATLERQMLLRRHVRPVLETVEGLVGLQAQEPPDPYLALWSRLDGFRPDDLVELFLERKVVRIAAMRATLHLLSADDCLVLRPLAQPVLDQELERHPEYGPALRGVDLAPVMAVARELLADHPHTGTELRAALGERFPDLHAAALAYACRNRLAFVQVPPRGLWRRSARVTSTTAEAWLGRPLAADPSLDEVVMRYLGAFGPALVADVATWSGLTGLREVVDRIRPRLRSFRDERGRELIDLPDAPRPDPDVPAPTRFLPEYDNVLLSHADRTRFVADEDRRRVWTGDGPVHGTVLQDGRAYGTWWVDRNPESGTATLEIRQLGRGTKAARTELADEGLRLLRFLDDGAGADHDVRFVTL
jgi:hypothetical protein